METQRWGLRRDVTEPLDASRVSRFDAFRLFRGSEMPRVLPNPSAPPLRTLSRLARTSMRLAYACRIYASAICASPIDFDHDAVFPSTRLHMRTEYTC